MLIDSLLGIVWIGITYIYLAIFRLSGTTPVEKDAYIEQSF